jgi:spoIIIJ-associated protein
MSGTSAYREFTGKSVEEALRLAREDFGVGLDDLDFEILTPGSRGVLGMGAEPARVLAAPRSELGGAAPKREAAAARPLPPPPPRDDREDRGAGAASTATVAAVASIVIVGPVATIAAQIAARAPTAPFDRDRGPAPRRDERAPWRGDAAPARERDARLR